MGPYLALSVWPVHVELEDWCKRGFTTGVFYALLYRYSFFGGQKGDPPPGAVTPTLNERVFLT